MITQVVIDGKTLEDNDITKKLYKILSKQIEITTLTEFYESLFRCIPLLEIEEGWFIREITKNKRIYESMKRLVEILLVVTTLPITLPLGIIISLSVIIFSKGSIIYHQERIGRNNVPFTLYKFRTMTEGIDGPLWTSENDARITKIGKFLRNTHIDELPQLWNVIKGDISFVGPRPERSKLVKVYEIIPFYETRHLIKPGITGWAQLNFKPSVSPEEAKKKIQFDLYYIKNRSFILDLFIILKTARAVFTDAN
jgi:lipopolysaccharide/colanic/teichoic acid biosynthesis glycosyltransferase